MKNLTIKYPIAIASVFIWIGFVGAISFIEAWLKFQAPGITLPLGLAIGRLVFNALNKVELVLSVVIIMSLFFGGIKNFKWEQLFFFIPFLLVILQTMWLLPALDARTEMHIHGLNVPASNLHFYYIGMEVIKIVCLMIFGIKLFKS